jgi:hypothetical protein
MWDELRLALVAGLVRALLLLALRFVCPLSPPRSLLLADSACWLWLQAPTSLNEGRGVVGFRLQSSWDTWSVRNGVQSKWCDTAVNVGVVVHVRGD